MDLPVLLKRIEKATSKFNRDMQDMNGDWLYQDRYEIERDLGMSIALYEQLIDLKHSIGILIKNNLNVKDFGTFSAKEMAAILQLK